MVSFYPWLSDAIADAIVPVAAGEKWISARELIDETRLLLDGLGLVSSTPIPAMSLAPVRRR